MVSILPYNIENYKVTVRWNNLHSFRKSIQRLKLPKRVSFESEFENML